MTDSEKIIKGLECCDHNGTHDDYELCVECPYDLSIYPIKSDGRSCKVQLLYDALALLKDTKWISANERMPDDDVDVLLFGKGKGIKVGYHSEGTWYDHQHDHLRGVTHWMPLPKPPKKKIVETAIDTLNDFFHEDEREHEMSLCEAWDIVYSLLKEQQKLIDEITQRRANNGAFD